MINKIKYLPELHAEGTFEEFSDTLYRDSSSVLSVLPGYDDRRDGVYRFQYRGEKRVFDLTENISSALMEIIDSDNLDIILREIGAMSFFHGSFGARQFRPTIVGVLLNSNDEVLLLKSSKGSFHFPQGGIGIEKAFFSDPSNSDPDYIVDSPILALDRELEEEVNVVNFSDLSKDVELSPFVVRSHYSPGRKMKVDANVGCGLGVEWRSGKDYLTAYAEVDSADFDVDVMNGDGEIENFMWHPVSTLDEVGINLEKTGVLSFSSSVRRA